MNDDDLLQAYVNDKSQAAFAELVRRHSAMVVFTSRRLVGTGGFTDDIAQAVFIALANKASTLEGRSLAGWLYRATGYAARHTIRTSTRRKQYESAAAKTEAVLMPVSAFEVEISSETFARLDAALQRSNDTDRGSVLHRFARDLSFAEVGSELGVSEEAARKRVTRAVIKLKQLMEVTGGKTPAVEGLLSTAFVSHPAKPLLQGLIRASIGSTHTTTTQAVLRGAARANFLAPRWRPGVRLRSRSSSVGFQRAISLLAAAFRPRGFGISNGLRIMRRPAV